MVIGEARETKGNMAPSQALLQHIQLAFSLSRNTQEYHMHAQHGVHAHNTTCEVCDMLCLVTVAHQSR